MLQKLMQIIETYDRFFHITGYNSSLTEKTVTQPYFLCHLGRDRCFLGIMQLFAYHSKKTLISSVFVSFGILEHSKK